MAFLFIGSTGDHAGQCLVSWAIAKRLLERGLHIGFFKPFGTGLRQVNHGWVDPDAFLFKEVLNLQEPIEVICPWMITENRVSSDKPNGILEEIRSMALKLSTGKDLLIIIGSRHVFFDDTTHSIPDITVISELNPDVVLVHRYRKVSTTLYSILSVNSLIRKNIRGTVINRIPGDQFEQVHDRIVPAISRNGSTNIALLPEDPFLSLWSIGEIMELLGGQIICGGEFLDRPVEGMTVGTSDLQGELLVFKRVYNKVILLGPYANSRGVVGILLTGNREPGHRIVEVAERSGTPLILVKQDAFSVKERLEQCAPTLTPADEDKVLHFMAMMDRDDFLNRLIRSIGWD